MKALTLLSVGIAIFILLPSSLIAQDSTPLDTTIIFTPSSPDLVSTTHYEPFRNAWGLDLMISNNGFGLGGFWRHEYS
ncbi:MAG: hypothetical protein ACRDGA_04775, partial [Bacteroidota bacterium]